MVKFLEAQVAAPCKYGKVRSVEGQGHIGFLVILACVILLEMSFTIGGANITV